MTAFNQQSSLNIVTPPRWIPGIGGAWQQAVRQLHLPSQRAEEPEFAQTLRTYRATRAYGASRPGLPNRGGYLADVRVFQEASELAALPVAKKEELEQYARNTNAIALLEQWLQDAEKGVDPNEVRVWNEAKESLEAHRTSARKLFP